MTNTLRLAPVSVIALLGVVLANWALCSDSLDINTPSSKNHPEEYHYDYGYQEFARTLVTEWEKSDGEAAIYFQRKIFWASLIDPDAFYTCFAEDSVDFERFLAGMDIVFVNFEDTSTVFLEQLKDGVLGYLKTFSFQIDDSNLEKHAQYMEKLRRVTVRGID